MGLLDEPDDLQLFCGRISHSPSSPSAVTFFFEQTVLQGQIGDHLLERRGLTPKIVDLVQGAARAVSPARRFFPASRKSFDQR